MADATLAVALLCLCEVFADPQRDVAYVQGSTVVSLGP